MNPRLCKALMSVVIVAVLALPALAVVPSAGAQDDPPYDVLIYIPWPSSSYAAKVGDTIWIASEWWVCRSPGLVRNFENAWGVELKVDDQVILDGSVNATRSHWWPVMEDETLDDMCHNHPDKTYGALWVYDLSGLEVGEHVIAWKTTQAHQVTDMYDWDQDGKPDQYPAGIIDDASATIVVTAE